MVENDGGKKQMSFYIYVLILYRIMGDSLSFLSFKILLIFPAGSDCRVCLQCRRPGFDHWVRKIPWRKKWQPILVFLPGKSHGQKEEPSGVTKSRTQLRN